MQWIMSAMFLAFTRVCNSSSLKTQTSLLSKPNQQASPKESENFHSGCNQVSNFWTNKSIYVPISQQNYWPCEGVHGAEQSKIGFDNITYDKSH